jgi:hypothetical protein
MIYYPLALLAMLMTQFALAQEKREGPPPRFITVKKVDQSKQEIIFDVQIVDQNPLDRPTYLVYPDGYQRLTLGTKPQYVHPAEGFKVSMKTAKWSSADGKEVSAEAAAKRLKPDVTVLLSSDGAELDQKYLRLFKAETLVLIVLAEELPVPYFPLVGGSIPVTHVRKR